MENDDVKKYKEDLADDMKNRHHMHNRMWGGLILVAIGSLLLARKLGAYIPDWLLSWPMLLIACGLLIGFKSNFRNVPGVFIQ